MFENTSRYDMAMLLLPRLLPPVAMMLPLPRHAAIRYGAIYAGRLFVCLRYALYAATLYAAPCRCLRRHAAIATLLLMLP